MRSRERAPRLMRLVAPLVIRTVRRIQDVRVQGADNIPVRGPLLLVSNHTCHLDALTMAVLAYEARRTPRIAGRADLFKVPVLGFVLRRLGQIPVYRSDVAHVPNDGGSPASSLRDMSRALDADGCLLVFPESTFTRDPEGWPMRGKTGTARLVLAHPRAVVVPVAHWGNEGIVDPWTGRIAWRKIGRKRTRLEVRVGPPVDLTSYRGREVTHGLLTEMTETIMTAITDQLSALRHADVAAGRGPRDRRWDRAIDGDPFEGAASGRSEQIARRLRRQAPPRPSVARTRSKTGGRASSKGEDAGRLSRRRR